MTQSEQRTTCDTSLAGHSGAPMEKHADRNRRRGLKERAVHEVRELVFIFLYLFVWFGLFTIHESIVLEQHHIGFTPYGLAAVNALILAKVMLVAQDLHLGHRFEDRPLVYPVLLKSLLFAIVFICFHVVEHVIVGLWYGKGILQSMPGFGGGGIDGVIMVGVLMSVALIPFFAFTEISRFFGLAALQSLIFKRGPNEFVVELRLRKQTGS
jgi:hypothetical protein